MEIVILVLGIFVIIWAVLMSIKNFHARGDKGFPYSRNKRRCK